MQIVQVKNLSYSYPQSSVSALKDISFSIDKRYPNDDYRSVGYETFNLDPATNEKAGLLSANDKKKLDNVSMILASFNSGFLFNNNGVPAYRSIEISDVTDLNSRLATIESYVAAIDSSSFQRDNVLSSGHWSWNSDISGLVVSDESGDTDSTVVNSNELRNILNQLAGSTSSKMEDIRSGFVRNDRVVGRIEAGNENNGTYIPTVEAVLETINSNKTTTDGDIGSLATVVSRLSDYNTDHPVVTSFPIEAADLSDYRIPSEKLVKNTITQAYDSLNMLIAGKVAKESGKGLSSNNFTDAYKDKLKSLPNGSNTTWGIRSQNATLEEILNGSENWDGYVLKQNGKGLIYDGLVTDANELYERTGLSLENIYQHKLTTDNKSFLTIEDDVRDGTGVSKIIRVDTDTIQISSNNITDKTSRTGFNTFGTVESSLDGISDKLDSVSSTLDTLPSFVGDAGIYLTQITNGKARLMPLTIGNGLVLSLTGGSEPRATLQSRIPDPPSTPGNYQLKLIVSNEGIVSYVWVPASSSSSSSGSTVVQDGDDPVDDEILDDEPGTNGSGTGSGSTNIEDPGEEIIDDF